MSRWSLKQQLLDTPQNQWIVISGYHFHKAFWGGVALVLGIIFFSPNHPILSWGAVTMGPILIGISIAGNIYTHRRPYLNIVDGVERHTMPTSSRAQIVATIGPATKEKSIMRQLVEHQMDVVRLNFSWGTYEEHAHYIATTREVAQEFNKTIPIIQDLSGPRVQTKDGHHVDPSAVQVLTEKDLKDLDFGISQNVEYVCMSYVGTVGDVTRLRDEISKRGGKAKVMAKVERQEALDNIDGIIAASDAIMIGRGDLGQNIPIERVPFAEQMIIQKCKAAKKPVITATQMLLSMVESAEPTRAEVTDIAYAILLGSDAVMLSEETARGKHPLEAVTIMERVVLEAEKHLPKLEINSL